jgi:hypothetical protein
VFDGSWRSGLSQETSSTFSLLLFTCYLSDLLQTMGKDSEDRSDRRHRSERSRSPRRERHRSRSPRRDDTDRSSRDKDREKDKDKDGRRRDDRDRERRKERRERSPSSDEEDVVLPLGAEAIGEEDYFLKATELKLWLWEKKGKVRF